MIGSGISSTLGVMTHVWSLDKDKDRGHMTITSALCTDHYVIQRVFLLSYQNLSAQKL